MLGHIRSGTLERYKEAFNDALNGGKGFAIAACDCTVTFVSQFDEACADAIFDQANWDSSKVRDKLRHVIDAHVATVRTAKLSELTSTFETKLNEALSVLPVEALLKGATDDTWPGIRELLQRETETAVFGFSSALSSFEMDEEIKEKGKIMLEGWLSRRQKKKQGGL
ncbi:hypothetical protein ACH5RR_024838 [Cinchona calisaya]|uniref:Sey1/RHD3-like three-helix bundle domain-containing protein n=1 Tax=Cinchona calisaya TaxID=153742 RepID=A0ABD2YXW9_9GENT